MNEYDSIDPAIQDARERYARFVECRDGAADGPPLMGLDVDDMIGATGDKLGRADVPEGSAHSAAEPELGRVESNKTLVVDAVDYLEGIYEDELYESCAQRAIEEMSARLAERLRHPLEESIKSLREPFRTVAVHCILLGTDPVEVARSLNTSAESIDFLTQTALDWLASHFTIG